MAVLPGQTFKGAGSAIAVNSIFPQYSSNNRAENTLGGFSSRAARANVRQCVYKGIWREAGRRATSCSCSRSERCSRIGNVCLIFLGKGFVVRRLQVRGDMFATRSSLCAKICCAATSLSIAGFRLRVAFNRVSPEGDVALYCTLLHPAFFSFTQKPRCAGPAQKPVTYDYFDAKTGRFAR